MVSEEIEDRVTGTQHRVGERKLYEICCLWNVGKGGKYFLKKLNGIIHGMDDRLEDVPGYQEGTWRVVVMLNLRTSLGSWWKCKQESGVSDQSWTRVSDETRDRGRDQCPGTNREILNATLRKGRRHRKKIALWWTKESDKAKTKHLRHKKTS